MPRGSYVGPWVPLPYNSWHLPKPNTDSQSFFWREHERLQRACIGLADLGGLFWALPGCLLADLSVVLPD
jgi:hypothetical protein